MPLPLILAGVALAGAGWGIKKGLDAKNDFNRAKEINEEAENIYEEAKNALSLQRDQAQKGLEQLGKAKFSLYEETIIPFVESFSQIKNIDFDDGKLLDLQVMPMSRDEIAHITQSTLEIKDALSGGITSLGAGGLAGMAAYGGVGLLGTTAGGTSIATLSGAAATNATLAWLGGGSLAAGGMGMAGGMAVLGGIVAGPVIAIGGMMLASKAEAAKEDAYSNRAEANRIAEEMKSAEVVVKAINDRSTQVRQVLDQLNQKLAPKLDNMIYLIQRNNNYSTYSSDEKKEVFWVATLAKTLKNIMETPLLTQDGTPSAQSQRAISLGQRTLSEI